MIALAVWSGILLVKVNLPAITPIGSILRYIPGGYSRGLARPDKSIGYLLAIGPVEIRFGDRIAPLDRNLLQLLKLEDEIKKATSSKQIETEETSADSILKTKPENEQALDFEVTENVEENESDLPVALKSILHEDLADYQGNVEFVDPDEFMIYFEKDLSGGNGESNDRLGVPFLAPVQPRVNSPKPRSSAIFEQN